MVYHNLTSSKNVTCSGHPVEQNPLIYYVTATKRANIIGDFYQYGKATEPKFEYH